MKNLDKIKKISTIFYAMIQLSLILVPVYYACYWIFINELPGSLIQAVLNPTDLISNKLSLNLKIAGFASSIFPMFSLIFILINLKKLFKFYKKGEVFLFEHVILFKKTAKGLMFWVFFSIIYESAKSVIFSFGNPPGSRLISVGFGSSELTLVTAAGMIFLISWIMDEARILRDENSLTI